MGIMVWGIPAGYFDQKPIEYNAKDNLGHAEPRPTEVIRAGGAQYDSR
jgi:hypothetical protein